MHAPLALLSPPSSLHPPFIRPSFSRLSIASGPASRTCDHIFKVRLPAFCPSRWSCAVALFFLTSPFREFRGTAVARPSTRGRATVARDAVVDDMGCRRGRGARSRRCGGGRRQGGRGRGGAAANKSTGPPRRDVVSVDKAARTVGGGGFPGRPEEMSPPRTRRRVHPWGREMTRPAAADAATRWPQGS